MNADNDLDAVRGLRADLAEPDDLVVSRTRYRLIRAVETPEPRRRGWLKAGLAAGASVGLAVAIAVVAVLATHPSGGGPGQGFAASGAPPSTGTASERPSPSVRPPAPAVDLTVTPVVLAPGQLLYLHTPDNSWEMWVDPNGAIPLAIRLSRNGQVTDDAMSMDAEAAKDRAELAANGPSLNHPTPAYLAGLPTDPHALLALIREQLAVDGGGHHREDLIEKNMSELLYKVEPLLSPALRAEFLAALALVPGAHVDHSPQTFAGQPVYTVAVQGQDTYEGFFVNTGTGRIVGDFAAVDKAHAQDASEVWLYGVATEVGVAP
jgi:hypothetical protein